MTSSGIPFVELYRPKNFEDIVLAEKIKNLDLEKWYNFNLSIK